VLSKRTHDIAAKWTSDRKGQNINILRAAY